MTTAARLRQGVKVLLSLSLILVFQVVLGPSLLGCDPDDDGPEQRPDTCMPSDWDDPKWQHTPQGRMRGESAPDPETARWLEAVKAYKTTVEPAEDRSADGLASSGESIGQLHQPIINGVESHPFTTAVVHVVVNVDTPQGQRTYRGTGLLLSDRVVLTSAHTFEVEGGVRVGHTVESVDIIVPTSSNQSPQPIAAVAWQTESSFDMPNQDAPDDIALIYLQHRLPGRAVPQQAVANYNAVTNCPNNQCPNRVVTIMGTSTRNDPNENISPIIRMGDTNVIATEQAGNSEYLYTWPPVVEDGDSGGPAFVGDQAIGIVWGDAAIPVQYAGQQHAGHVGNRIQLLNMDRIRDLVATFQQNVDTYVVADNDPTLAEDAPWTSPDNRFGFVEDIDTGNEHWTRRTLRNALAVALTRFIQQRNPPPGAGCGPHP